MSRQTWLQFLDTQNATLINNEVANFGDFNAELMAASNNNIICDLSHLGLISVCGEEAESFLQNQLSNDIRKISDTASQLSAYCSAKGRVISLFRIWSKDKSYYLQLPRERVEATIKRLRMFILMTQATVEDASDKWISIGISGPNATDILNQQGLLVPTETNQVVTQSDLSIIKLPGLNDRFEIVGTTVKLQSIWIACCSRAKPAGAAAWTWLDIQSGIPNVYDATVEAFVPQMINLHSLNGISFTKGCYPGQEVVARVHYLGKQKRRMYLAHIDLAASPKIGDNITVATTNSNTNQSVGKVVSASPSPDGGYDVLAVLQIDSAENETLQMENRENGLLMLKELPYSVEVEGS